MNLSLIKKTLDLLTYGVYIIGVKHESKINGMTAAWVSQVSSNPPMVSVAIGKTHYTTELIPKANSFSVNILSTNQFELAKKCGMYSGRDKAKLQDIDLIYQETGAPILKECVAYLDCKLTYQCTLGDHILFVGTVVKAAANDQDILVFKANDFFN
jgi:flavin reductase (DIM6/NTAB) family NADH-FMN oxidoreductase RutF